MEIRNSFIFYSSFYEAINELPDEDQGPLYKAIIDYAFAGISSKNLSGVSKGFFALIKPNIDAANARHDANIENGKRGGRPPKEKTETKPNRNPNHNPNETQIETETKPNQNPEYNPSNNPNHNPRQNLELERELDIDKDIKLVKNIFFDYKELNKSACARVRERTAAERKEFLTNFKEFFSYHQTGRFAEVGYEILDTLIEAYEQAQTSSGLTFKQKKYNAKTFYPVFEISEKSFESIVTQLAFNSEIENRPAYILGAAISAMEVIT